jgi:hypothetical protein
MHLKRMFTAGALAAATAGALALGTAGMASAANVGSRYSADLAGFSTAGNGSTVYDGEWRQVTVPAEPSTVTPDTVVAGIIMAHNLSTGGFAVAEGLVLNDPAGCGPGTWTVEGGTGTVTLPGQPVLPASDLHPLLFFGEKQCFTGGGSEFLYLYHSSKYALVHFSAGPSSKYWDVLATAGVPVPVFRTTGAGILTCTTAVTACPSADNGASQLVQGSMFDGSGVGFYVNGQGNSVFGQGKNLYTQNYINWIGTETGGPPTTGNLVTLDTTPATTLFGPYGPFTENVPVIAGHRA